MIEGPNTRPRALAELFDAALQQGSTHEAHIATYRRDGTEVGKDLAHVRVAPVISGGGISHILVVMAKDRRAEVFPAPSDFERDKRHTDGHGDLGPHNEGSPRSSEGVGAGRACVATADHTTEFALQRPRRHKADQEDMAEQRRQRRPQHTARGVPQEVRKQRLAAAMSEGLALQQNHVLRRENEKPRAQPRQLDDTEAPASRPTVVVAPEAHNEGLVAALTSILCFVIGVLVSIMTLGALPMPWAQTHLQPSRHASSRRDGCATRRAAYLREWELLHHSGMASSLLEDFNVY